jgi:type I restriction enzyme R subunit
MRQAIEEGFILDVLRNYTPYDLAFRLTHNGADVDERQVERSAAMKGVMQWVRLHPYNIASKVQVVVEHYRENVQPLLDGKAKAMVVVASRKEAVRWQKAIRGYIERQGYALGVLVAFSGEIDDPESFPESVTEASKLLNPGLNGQGIREAFARADHHLLLVANKFQTGFDQPLLCGMYVDKLLGGIQAVQTLSRLNRSHPGKDTTYILDFVNDPAAILQAFRTYYETAELEAATDPHLVFDLRAKLDASGHYDTFEVDRVAHAETDPRGTQAQLSAAIAPVADRLLRQYKAARQSQSAAAALGDDPAIRAAKDTLDALLLFKSDMGAFIRLYAFLSQMFDYGNTGIEKRFLFYKRLVPLLEFGRERDEVDLSGVVLTHHTLCSEGRQPLNLDAEGRYKLPPMGSVGSGSVQEKQRAYLSEIIDKVNGLFEGQLSDEDQLAYVNGVKGKLLENPLLVRQATSNNKDQFGNSPDLDDALLHAIMEALDAHATMSSQALGSARVRDGLKDILLGPAQLYEALRVRAAHLPSPP